MSSRWKFSTRSELSNFEIGCGVTGSEILGTSPAKGPKNKGFLGSVPTRSPWRSCCRAGDRRWKNELTWLRRFRMA